MIIPSRKNWKYWLPISLGIFVLINSIIWIVLSGGRWFEEIDPSLGYKPKYYNDLNRVFGPFYMLAYFTVQTNLFIGVMLIALPIFHYKSKTESWYMGSVILITITFLVYWLLIAPFNEAYQWKSPFFVISNVFLHGVNPIISFLIMFLIRKDVIIDKRILGFASLWMTIFSIFNAIFYGASSTVNKETSTINGSTIYGFLDLQILFFYDFSSMPALAIFLNILVCLTCCFLPILVSFFWIEIFKIKTTENSYFIWIDKMKKKFKTKR